MKEGSYHPRHHLKDMTLCECKEDTLQVYNNSAYTSNRCFQAGDVMGLLWATPVRADKLGAALEKYLKCRPRFQNGMITWYCCLKRVNKSLPRELVPIIERYYYEACLPVTDADNDWHLRYHCAQGTCTEFSHVVLSNVLERCGPKLHFENCPKDSSCQLGTLVKKEKSMGSAAAVPAEMKPELAGNEDSFSAGDESVGDSTYGSIDVDDSICTYRGMSADEFRDKLEDYVLGIISSGDGRNEYMNRVFEEHIGNMTKWQELINKGPRSRTRGEGNFVKLDKVLKDDFGLEVQFFNHLSHSYDGCKAEDHPDYACLAYLHLPSKMMTPLSFATYTTTIPPMTKRTEHSIHGVRYFQMEEVQAWVEDLQGKLRRFKEAMTILDLEPFIHPLEFHLTMDSSHPKFGECGKEKIKQARKDYIERKEGEQWPQFMQLTHVKPAYNWDVTGLVMMLRRTLHD